MRKVENLERKMILIMFEVTIGHLEKEQRTIMSEEIIALLKANKISIAQTRTLFQYIIEKLELTPLE